MKKRFIEPRVEIVHIDQEDIITTSSTCMCDGVATGLEGSCTIGG